MNSDINRQYGARLCTQLLYYVNYSSFHHLTANDLSVTYSSTISSLFVSSSTGISFCNKAPMPLLTRSASDASARERFPHGVGALRVPPHQHPRRKYTQGTASRISYKAARKGQQSLPWNPRGGLESLWPVRCFHWGTPGGCACQRAVRKRKTRCTPCYPCCAAVGNVRGNDAEYAQMLPMMQNITYSKGTDEHGIKFTSRAHYSTHQSPFLHGILQGTVYLHAAFLWSMCTHIALNYLAQEHTDRCCYNI